MVILLCGSYEEPSARKEKETNPILIEVDLSRLSKRSRQDFPKKLKRKILRYMQWLVKQQQMIIQSCHDIYPSFKV